MQYVYNALTGLMLFTLLDLLIAKKRTLQALRHTVWVLWAFSLEILAMGGIDAHRHMWVGALSHAYYSLTLFVIGVVVLAPFYRRFYDNRIGKFMVGNQTNIHPNFLFVRFLFTRNSDKLEKRVMKDLELRLRTLREQRNSAMPTKVVRDTPAVQAPPSLSNKERRRQKLANYAPKTAETRPISPSTKDSPAEEIRTTTRHIFLREIEDRRLTIDHLLPENVNAVMAKEIIRVLLVLGRRQSISESQYLPMGFVHHRTEERYQGRSGRAFDFPEFRRTLNQLIKLGIVVFKKKPGRKEKVMLSLRSVPKKTIGRASAEIVTILNQLKQDALNGRLS